MPKADQFHPHSPAPTTGFFEELDVFGSRTGLVVFVNQGEPLPGAPRSFMWRPIEDLTVTEIRARAREYREMAATAVTAEATQGVLLLAGRLERLADMREAGSPEATDL